MAAKKIHTIIVSRKGRTSEVKGTLEELTVYFKYTLEVGKSYEREKGNKKINTTPKTIGTLVNNLNNAKSNAAANGYSNTSYGI